MTLEEEALERARESEGITKKASEDKRFDGFFNLVGNAVVPKNKNSNEITATAAKGASYTPNTDYSDGGTSSEPARILRDVAQQTVNNIPESEAQSLAEDTKKIALEERNETKQFANEVLFDRYNPEYAKSNPYIARYLTEDKFKGTFVEIFYNKANDFVDSQVADYKAGQENSARYFKENRETTEYLKREYEKIENQDYDLLDDKEQAEPIYFRDDMGKASLNGGIAVLHETADTLDYYTAGKENNINISDDDDNGTRNSGMFSYMVQNLLVKPMKSIGRFEYKSKNADESIVLKLIEETSMETFDRYAPLSIFRTISKIPVDVDKEYQKLTARGVDGKEAIVTSGFDALKEPTFDEGMDYFAEKYKKGRYKILINTATDVGKGIYKTYNRETVDYSKMNRTIDVALMNSFAKKAVEQFVHETKMNLLDNEITSGDSTDVRGINSVIYIEPDALLNITVKATGRATLGVDIKEITRANFAGEMIEVAKKDYISLVINNERLHKQLKDDIAFDDSYVTNKRLRFQEEAREYSGDVLLPADDLDKRMNELKVKKENLYIYHSIKNSRNFMVPKRKRFGDSA